MDECTTLNSKLHEIDNEIVFFGNYENQQGENMTVAGIKRLWMELKDIGMFPASECNSRAKRDEDRYMFWVNIEQFMRDMKKAHAFVEAKKLKQKQKQEHASRLEGPPPTPREKSEDKPQAKPQIKPQAKSPSTPQPNKRGRGHGQGEPQLEEKMQSEASNSLVKVTEQKSQTEIPSENTEQVQINEIRIDDNHDDVSVPYHFSDTEDSDTEGKRPIVLMRPAGRHGKTRRRTGSTTSVTSLNLARVREEGDAQVRRRNSMVEEGEIEENKQKSRWYSFENFDDIQQNSPVKPSATGYEKLLLKEVKKHKMVLSRSDSEIKKTESSASQETS
eukprot:TRINITY_DN1421_c0_g1_i2.p1 TRINITY_DN1421_c0_g1~~TRINITY_DN1421_c0_g1_i2.p1  ORF type:complete len:332 (-),score=71.13 TRINITY_DN1421_c0_g1_i2:147-1142(-)